VGILKKITNFNNTQGNQGRTTMKLYTIYVNSQGDHKAVKQGWSWPAFLFTWMWAITKNIWMLSKLSAALLVILLMIAFIMASLTSSASMNAMMELFMVYMGYLIIAFSFIMGAKGNQWVKDSLMIQGYTDKESIVAQNSAAAIVLYREGSNNTSLMEA
jgi:hypothetical protein